MKLRFSKSGAKCRPLPAAPTAGEAFNDAISSATQPGRTGGTGRPAARQSGGGAFAGFFRHVAFGVVAVLGCVAADGAIVNTNESLTTASGSVPAFTLPAGTNLLNSGNAFTPATPDGFVHGAETTSSSWATLTDGSLGTAGTLTASNTPNNGTSLVIPLDLSVNTHGYDITQFDAYGAWGDSGRDNLNFTIQFSTVQAPSVFNNLAVINNQTSTPVNSTHTRLTEDSTGILARWVHSVKFVFANQENSWVGYREFILQGTPSLTAPGSVRIMPLGDSITQGAGAPGGYRNKLYQSLSAAGYAVDFVGNQSDNPAASLPDSDHEGHGGWIISPIDQSIAGFFNSIADPDVILLHIGTNDFGSNNDPTHAIDRLDSLITKMATLRPYAHIIVTNLMERGEPYNTTIQAQFNPYVQARVDAQAALGRRVTFLDMRSAVPLAEMPDQLHPGQAGYDHMADAWLPAIQAVVGTEGDSLPPGITRAQGLADLTHVTITFSKPVADVTATAGNFALSGGLTVSAAALDPSKHIVTLTTSTQTNAMSYTATVNGVFDRTNLALPLAADSTVTFTGATARGYLNNVPEAAGYTLAYSLDIPNAANYTAGAVAYAVDNHNAVGPFSRVAYYLELQAPGGDVQYVWASVNAFTTDAGKIAVPTFNSGAVFQQPVTGMNVVSNVAGVSTGTGLTGNLEFWPNTYDTPNGAGVAGASGTTYDFGDTRTSGAYGSMQLHNPAAAQTIFAFNNWGTSPVTANIDLGIGNGTGANPDWTFSNNSAGYAVKSLQVLVQTIGDTTAPTISSATATSGGTQVLVHFSEPLAAASVLPGSFSLDHGVVVLGATLAANQRDVYLITTPQPAATTLTLSVSGIRDNSPAANLIAAATTLAVTAPALPAEIVTNIGAAASGYQLVASIEVPVQGNFNAGNAAYTYDDRAAISPYTRVAYYLELQKPSQPSQYVWVSMDAFTGSRAKLTIPTIASGAVFQQNVTNLNVVSNVSGVINGSTASGGNIEFWPQGYTQGNAITIPNASATNYDTGDTRTGTAAGYGCMQIHNHDPGANQTVLAVNDFGVDGNVMDVGIGNDLSPVGTGVDWTFSNNSADYSRRILHVLVLPGTTAVPANVAANVAASAGYQLAYSITLPASGNATSLSYSVNNSAAIGSFSRIAYYLELQTGTATPKFIWTSMNAFTTDATKIAIPTGASGAFFQQTISNMDVLSNVAGIVNGSTASGGNIEFWPGNYTEGNAIGIPNANGGTFDFGDTANGGNGYGSMQVHNHDGGAKQTLFAFNNFGNTSGTQTFDFGIGNNPAPVNNATDWTFSNNGNSYSSRILHVFVLPGDPDATGPTLVGATPSTTLDRLVVLFNETVSDSSAIPANFSIPGLTVTGAAILASQKEIALTTSAQVPGTVYTLNVSGVRDRASSANLLLAGATTTFSGFTPPAVLANVAETSGYKLIYKLALPSTSPLWNLNAIPYSVDETRYGEQLFDRVAYLLELNGSWAYASFDRHTQVLAKVGVPTTAVTGATTPFQQNVTNLNVASNVAGVVTGTGLTGGNIEFWGLDYTTANALAVPNASASTYDFGDTMALSGGHGCLQVHNHEAPGQTILAFNNWGQNTGTTSVGIGNNPSGNPDWTGANNAGSYTTRNLYVLVRPANTTAAVGSAPILLSQPASRLLNAGDTTTFAIAATGSTSFTYQWRFNGAAISGATSPWFVLGPVGPADGGSYDVVVTGANQASTTSTAALVTVNSLTYGGFSFTTRRNSAILLARAALLAKATGQGVDLTDVSAASAQGGSLTLGPAGVTYTPASNFLGNDRFTITLADGFGHSIIGTVNATVTAATAIAPGQSLLAIRTDGKMDLLFSATALQGYAIQRGSDLNTNNWTTLATLHAGDDGLLPFTDPNPPAGKAFYRLTWVQP